MQVFIRKIWKYQFIFVTLRAKKIILNTTLYEIQSIQLENF